MPFLTVGLLPRLCRPLKESVGKSRRDAMFIEKLEPIDLGEPIYGRTIVGCAPKGAPTSQLCLPFYRHFTATRFFPTDSFSGRQSIRPFQGRIIILVALSVGCTHGY